MNSKQHIMVVDDDVAICEFLRMFLDGLGYHGVTVNSAEEAVQQYSAERPEAVIMDVFMPGGMDGLGALAAFKKIDRDVPVIVISGQGRTNTVVQAVKLGAFDFISKPFDEADLEALLADALRPRRFNRDVSVFRNGLQQNPMLFGVERGAFTGAIQQKPGKFEFANKGTIFLDEIGDMSYPLQAKLLQVLQDREFTRLGGKQDIRVDVRVISATNKDLPTACAEGQFRDDLYFRLNVVSINLPPLRERRDEIPILTEYFLRKYSAEYSRPYTEVSPETMQMFMDYGWPGNIRELQNLVRRIVVLGTESPVRKEIGLGFPVAARR